MTEIQGSKDCGNSPKNKTVQDIAIGLAVGDIAPDLIDDDVVWQPTDSEAVSGRETLMKSLADQPVPQSVTVDHAVSHGKVGAASGEIVLANGHRRRFCHVIEFTSAKAAYVAAIKSYA